MAKAPKVGDIVDWNTQQGKTTGVVSRKVPKTASVKGYTAEATKAQPEFEVRSSKSGKKAIHAAKRSSRMAEQRRTGDARSNRANPIDHASEDHTQTRREFGKSVNMTMGRLTTWLSRPESRTVGFKGAGDGESVGHRSGRRIVRLLAKRERDLTAGDYAHMRKVIGYVHRHLAQRPSGDVRDTPWRYSLMNWGHDPLRGTSATD